MEEKINNLMGGRRARVAYICHEYPKYTETFVYREIDRLRRLGMDVVVFASKRPVNHAEGVSDIDGAEEKIRAAKYLPPDMGGKFWWAQVKAASCSPLRYLSLLIKILSVDAHRSVAPLKIRLGQFLRGALAAHMMSEESEIRAIHSPATGDELIVAHVASVLSGIPLSFTVHAPLAMFRLSPLLATQARHAAFIAAVSEDARRRIIDLAGSEITGRVEVIHCGVDLPEGVSPADGTPPRVVSVGSLGKLKGHDVLIRAVGLLISRGVDVYCDIVGEGPEKVALEGLISELGIEDRVRLPGRRSPGEVKHLLNEARCFALACRVDERGDRDGVPVALMEAMACSRPCVSTLISGIPELIKNGETGLLVEPDDPEALADAIGKLIGNPELALKMGNNSRERVARAYSLEEGARKLKREFTRLAHSLAYISHEYPKITETFVKREVEALRGAGLRVVVYSIRRPVGTRGLNPLADINPWCDIVYLPSNKSPRLYWKAFSVMVGHPLRSASLLLQAVRSVGTPGAWRAGWGGVLDVVRGAWIASCLGPEVSGVHGSFAGVDATCAWAAGDLAGAPFGFSSHSSPPDPLLKNKCRDAAWIFSESDFDKNYLAELVGAQRAAPLREKIFIVRCGLDPAEWPEPDWEADRYASGPALFVGTLGPKKGVVTLMEAMVRLFPELGIELEVVGDGPMLGRMKSILGAAAECRVRFHGDLPFDDLMDLYRRARLLILPSTVTPEGDRDGIPVTLMEAMASGMPCVTTPVSGIPELVEDAKTGLLVTPEDDEELAEAVRSLWNDPGRCRDMGKNGRRKVFDIYTMDRQVRDFVAGLKRCGVIPHGPAT